VQNRASDSSEGVETEEQKNSLPKQAVMSSRAILQQAFAALSGFGTVLNAKDFERA
jgi:hypothetical protein